MACPEISLVIVSLQFGLTHGAALNKMVLLKCYEHQH